MMGGSGLLLLAAVGGYLVLERAQRQKGNLKKVGRLLGTVIILVSLLGVACRVWSVSTGMGGVCAYSGKAKTGYFCPFSKRSVEPASGLDDI